MSKQELLELVAPLSMEERRELREILDAAPLVEVDTAWQEWEKFLDDMPALNLPSDFGANHDHYIHGAPKRNE